jgi:hypothetical protein
VPTNERVTAVLRNAIESHPESRRRIAVAAGVLESTLSRFVNGKAGIDGTTIDKLCVYLGLELKPGRGTRRTRRER